MLVYLRDGSAQTILRAASLRQMLQINLSTSPTVYWHEADQSQRWPYNARLNPEKMPAHAEFKPGLFRSRGERLNH